MNNIKSLILLVVISTVIASCASRKVTRVDPAEQIDLSGRWNDTDSRQVAEEMTRDVLSKPWLERFTGQQQRPPAGS